MNLDSLSQILSIGATIAFSSTAVLAIREDRQIDLFGATVLGIVTAVGGGTMRDLIADAPVFWGEDVSYIWIALVAGVLSFYTRKFLKKNVVHSAMLYLDGIGAAMFAIQATAKVYHLGFGGVVGPVILGITTAIGGGLIRDTLASRPNLLLSPELYAVPILFGCSAYVAILELAPPEYHVLGANVCILGTFGVRAAAIHWGLTMPRFTRL